MQDDPHKITMDEGIVVLLEIPCAEKQPVQFAGVEYIRIGTNKKNLKEYPDKERELWRTFDSTPYELRTAMSNLDEDSMISFPEIAIREMLANAMIHQDLQQRGTNPMVEVFKNRIEFSNAGFIKVMDPDTAPRYKKYVPFWA